MGITELNLCISIFNINYILAAKAINTEILLCIDTF